MKHQIHMPSDKSPWRLAHFTDQKELRLEWERLRIRILQRGNDLLLVEKRGETSEDDGIQMGGDPESDFRRYAFEKPIESIRISPRTPNRPLVVQPTHPLRLAPKAKVDFYVSVPVDIQLSTGSRNNLEDLECIRSEILSDTWFGDRLSGILCYALKSRARREYQSIDSSKSARAICKIHIENESNEQLHCTKFCLRLDHCHLWQTGNALWTSPISIRYNGSEELSSVDYSTKAPTEAENADQITEATEEPLSGLIRRTFAGLSNNNSSPT